MICTASDFDGSELCKKTHIPKHLLRGENLLCRFGAVQKKHIYQNSIESNTQVNYGLELYKYAYTKTLLSATLPSNMVRSCTNTHIPKHISQYPDTLYWFGAVQIHIYKTESLYYLPKNLVRSCTNTHIQKLCSLSTM